jgi:nicotinamide-nucleotide amidase
MKRAAQRLAAILKEENLSIAFAESITCGMLSYEMGAKAGAGDFFQGGIVCYDEKTKRSLLGIKESLLNKHTAESLQVTDALARNLRDLIT